jgi:hypothetical protein
MRMFSFHSQSHSYSTQKSSGAGAVSFMKDLKKAGCNKENKQYSQPHTCVCGTSLQVFDDYKWLNFSAGSETGLRGALLYAAHCGYASHCDHAMHCVTRRIVVTRVTVIMRRLA